MGVVTSLGARWRCDWRLPCCNARCGAENHTPPGMEMRCHWCGARMREDRTMIGGFLFCDCSARGEGGR